MQHVIKHDTNDENDTQTRKVAECWTVFLLE